MFDALAEVDFIGLSKKVTQECISFYEMIQNLIKEQEFLEISEIVDLSQCVKHTYIILKCIGLDFFNR
jgi:hypothetical protein